MAEQFMPDQITTGLDILPAPPDLRSATPAEQPRMLKYYKNPSYFSKNWAPEQVPEASVRSLAKAASLAVKQGVLAPQLADRFLANALVEGYTGGPATVTRDARAIAEDERWMDAHGAPEDAPLPPLKITGKDVIAGKQQSTTPQFGVGYAIEDSPRVRSYLSAMGLQAGVHLRKSGEGLVAADPGDADTNAKIAAVVLANKAAAFGNDKAIERFNGVGPRAQRHAQRVEVMQQMLQHPSNRALLEAYTQYRNEP